jgi:pilus assembly protein Flp/PilA
VQPVGIGDGDLATQPSLIIFQTFPNPFSGFVAYLCLPNRGKDREMQSLKTFLVNEDGPTAVEYAVMLALIIVVCVTAIATLGSNANKTYTKVGTTVTRSTSS